MNIIIKKQLYTLIFLSLCWNTAVSASECGGKADCGWSASDIAPKKKGWEICNRSKQTINVAIGFHKNGKWRSKGPYFIGYKQCTQVLRHFFSPHLYYLARKGDDVFHDGNSKGDASFCIPTTSRLSFEFVEIKGACQSSLTKWSVFDYVKGNKRSGYSKTFIQ